MKVVFKTNLVQVINNLFNNPAFRVIENRRTALWASNYKPFGAGSRSEGLNCEYRHITSPYSLHFDSEYRLEDVNFSSWATLRFTQDGMVITTAMSDFTYTFVGDVCTYEGAYRGFLNQNLLPQIEVDEILEVYNSKEDFFLSLEEYARHRS